MKAKMTVFGVALLSTVASGALFFSQPSFARDEGDDAFTEDFGADVAPDFGGEAALNQRAPKAKLSDLAGSWAISVGGNTGCGLSTLYFTVTLDAAGAGMATLRGSSTGCPPSSGQIQPFQIQTLAADGSGTASLSCGLGCGWSFIIQVPKGNNNLFTLVDVVNPNNVLVGTAARMW